MSTKLEHLLAKLKKVRRAGSGVWRAACPAHNDPEPSLIITVGEGRILLHCHGGCPVEAVLDALGIGWSDLVSDEAASSRARKSNVLLAADAEIRDKVYRHFLAHLPLLDGHIHHLVARGLTRPAIDFYAYRSLSPIAASRAARSVFGRFGQMAARVPGFLSDGRCVAYDGIVIPVRQADGRIIALQIRHMAGRLKYTYFSGGGGPSSGTPPHVPRGVMDGAVNEIRLTEGPLKADVANFLDQSVPCVAVANVSTWPRIQPVLTEMGTRRVWLAFDADWETKWQVAAALDECVEALRPDYEVGLEYWDVETAKGIDDLLQAGYLPLRQMLEGGNGK